MTSPAVKQPKHPPLYHRFSLYGNKVVELSPIASYTSGEVAIRRVLQDASFNLYTSNDAYDQGFNSLCDMIPRRIQ